MLESRIVSEECIWRCPNNFGGFFYVVVTYMDFQGNFTASDRVRIIIGGYKFEYYRERGETWREDKITYQGAPEKFLDPLKPVLREEIDFFRSRKARSLLKRVLK
ncbi:hypothetical protein GF386_01520 [Candidatus Pacearchaeota archaeon]|nr:hypothetical protein [Candidatus Pacearchaeota archaeon]MBD3282861.1 hypothetical protein [Candidatus Pacearchaeota archaeon]